MMAVVKTWLRELDELLRGDKTREMLLTRGTCPLRVRHCVMSAVFLGISYGFFMGLYAVLTRQPPCWPQMLSTAIKVPLLFLLTLVVTFPSLYVFSALLGTPLHLLDTLRVLVGAIAVTLCVLAAFGPITGFFTVNTTSYAFVKLLNVGFFVKVLGALDRGLQSGEPPEVTLQAETAPFPAEAASPSPTEDRQRTPAKPARQPRSRVSKVLAIWILLYALVGAQMGWILRPFIGAPDMTFQWFRAREANVFIDIVRTIGDLVK
jgi:hypothetical protein